jgi:hypothetical protein
MHTRIVLKQCMSFGNEDLRTTMSRSVAWYRSLIERPDAFEHNNREDRVLLNRCEPLTLLAMERSRLDAWHESLIPWRTVFFQ